jgi:hypothetical protein
MLMQSPNYEYNQWVSERARVFPNWQYLCKPFDLDAYRMDEWEKQNPKPQIKQCTCGLPIKDGERYCERLC